MNTIIGRLLIAVVLAAAAWLSWSESTLASRVADAKQDVATLNHDHLDALVPAAAVSDYLPGERRRLADEIAVTKSTAAYWLGRYGAVVSDSGGTETDADMLLAAANAAFREAQRDRSTGAAAVQRLDGVLQAYASALKAGAAGRQAADAAYNFEYVARLRDRIARVSQGRIARVPPASGPVMGGDLPSGSTIHGGPGAPPPEAKMEELQMIAPMEYGDREQQPVATPGVKRERKG